MSETEHPWKASLAIWFMLRRYAPWGSLSKWAIPRPAQSQTRPDTPAERSNSFRHCMGGPDRHLFTDASGSWGCGAWAMPHWLQSPWPSHHCLSSIALKELIPVVLAAATWGSLWGGSCYTRIIWQWSPRSTPCMPGIPQHAICYAALPSSRPTSTSASGQCILRGLGIQMQMTCPVTTAPTGQPTALPSSMPGASRLDISALEGEVCRFLEAGLAESTRKVYKAGWNHCLSFSQSLSIPASPVTIESATLFAAYLGAEGLSVSTIES